MGVRQGDYKAEPHLILLAYVDVLLNNLDLSGIGCDKVSLLRRCFRLLRRFSVVGPIVQML